MKVIRSVEDLAINGAKPAYIDPIHVGRPNLGDRTMFLEYVQQIFDRNWLTNNGPLVQELEQKIARLHNVTHCVAMVNGTVALEIAIRALEMTGEVIVPSYTFVATAHALQWQEITPVFADIDPETHNLDPDAVRRMITPRTTGIIGVHLWGRCAPVDALQAIADEHGLQLMFDASHAFGCSHNGTMIGGFGSCEVMSFHATKCFNTFEGGAVLTDNEELAKKMRLMRNFGFSGFDNVIYPGTNGKMTEISAAMGLVSLQAMDSVFDANRQRYAAYKQAFSDLEEVKLLRYQPETHDKNNFQYIIAELMAGTDTVRDAIVDALHAENILVRKYFWPGCHNMEPYRSLYPHAGMLLDHTNQVSRRVIVLPNGSDVDGEVIQIISQVFRLLINQAGQLQSIRRA